MFQISLWKVSSSVAKRQTGQDVKRSHAAGPKQTQKVSISNLHEFLCVLNVSKCLIEFIEI